MSFVITILKRQNTTNSFRPIMTIAALICKWRTLERIVTSQELAWTFLANVFLKISKFKNLKSEHAHQRALYLRGNRICTHKDGTRTEVNSQFQIFLFLFLNLLSCRSERFNCQAPVQGQSVAFGHTQTRQPVPGGDASFTVQPPVTPTLNLFKSVSRLWTHVISWSSWYQYYISSPPKSRFQVPTRFCTRLKDPYWALQTLFYIIDGHENSQLKSIR